MADTNSNEGVLMELMNDVRTIKEALLGNPLRKDSGISGTLDNHESRLIKIESKVDVGKWFIGGLGFAMGITGSITFEFIKSLFHK